MTAAVIAIAVASVDPHLLYETWRHFDPHSSHQRIQQVTDTKINTIQNRAMGAGAVYGAVAVALLMFRERLQRIIAAGIAYLADGCPRIRRCWRQLSAEDQMHALIVALLTGLATVLGLLYSQQTIRSDEAASFFAYGNRSIVRSICFYSANNHILHSVLMRLSVVVFGDALWAIRLPTLIGAVVMVPLQYAVGRSYFSRNVGLLAAAMTASSAYLVDLATNARGYTLMTDCFLAMLLLTAPFARRQPEAWFGFVVLAALGAWTVPVMIYPLVIVVLFLLLDHARLNRLQHFGRFMAWLMTALATVGLVIILLYLPTFLTAHTASDSTVQLIRHETYETTTRLADRFISRIGWFWDMATLTWPRWLAVFGSVLAGIGALTCIHDRPRGFLLFAATVLSPVTLTLATRVIIPPWSFAFLFPIYVLFATAGTLFLVRLGLGRRTVTAAGAVALAVVLVVLNLSLLLSSSYPLDLPHYVGYYDAREAAEYLADRIRPDVEVQGHHLDLRPVLYHVYRKTGQDKLPQFADGTSAKVVYVVENFDREAVQQHIEHLRQSGYRLVDMVTLPHSRIRRYHQKHG